MDDMTKLAKEFTPLYSFRMPPWWKTLPGILTITGMILVLIALIGFGIWYKWFYEPPLTFEQWHTKEFKALRSMLKKEQVNHKQFFGAVTFLFKQYLYRLYGWNVSGKTDEELWEFVVLRPEIDRSLHEPIKELLSYAQVVKFADQTELNKSTEQALATLEEIVDTLRMSALPEKQ
jgi:hypothetical protein